MQEGANREVGSFAFVGAVKTDNCDLCSSI